MISVVLGACILYDAGFCDLYFSKSDQSVDKCGASCGACP